MSTILTPAQTCGPLFGFALFPEGLTHTVDPAAARAVTIEGAIFDGAGESVGYGSFIEFWSDGQTCRARTIAGKFRAVLARPAPLTIEGVGTQAPHIHVALFARGVTRQLVTRLYFPEDSAAHASDPVLQQIDPTRRSTLIGHSAGDGRTYRFDIRLHGEGETVFFDTTLC